MILKRLFYIILALSSTAALAANEGGHGGDSDALDFAIAGQKVVSALKILKQSDFPEFTFSDFENGVDTATISMVSKALYKNNIEVNALNFPDKKLIEVNRGRWRGPLKSVKARLGLVFHEYLGIVLGTTGKLPVINDDNYHITTRFLSKVNLGDFTSIIPQWSCAALCYYHSNVYSNGYLYENISSDGLTGGDAIRELTRTCTEFVDRLNGGKMVDYGGAIGLIYRYGEVGAILNPKFENGDTISWDYANIQNACVKNY